MKKQKSKRTRKSQIIICISIILAIVFIVQTVEQDYSNYINSQIVTAQVIDIEVLNAFAKPFDVTFENDERVQVSEGCVCRIKNDGNVIFEGSGVEMSEKTVEYIKKNAAKYLVDVTKLF